MIQTRSDIRWIEMGCPVKIKAWAIIHNQARIIVDRGVIGNINGAWLEAERAGVVQIQIALKL